MAAYRVTFDFGNLPARVQLALHQHAPGIRAAVERTAAETQAMWQASVLQAPGLTAQQRDGYAKSIGYAMVGAASAVVTANDPLAGILEQGRPARDLKAMLQTSRKTRMVQHGKNTGQKYLIIPLRHNTSGSSAHARAMPADIQRVAQAMGSSAIIGTSVRRSATGHQVRQLQYRWGEHLPEGMAPKMAKHHSTDIYAGMVRMNTSSGKQKSSAYLTFRVMGEWQSGKWLVAAKPGLGIIADVQRAAQERLNQNMALALQAGAGG